MRYLSLEEVIYIYTELIQRTGGQPGIRDEKILEEVLAKPLVAFEGEELYPDLFTKVSVLMYALVNSKPFVSGNKRIAVMCGLFILRSNGYQLIVKQDKLIDVVMGIENGSYTVDYLISWFQKNSLPV